MPRKLFTIAAGVSAVLFVAVCGLWAWGARGRHELVLRRSPARAWVAGSGHGAAYVFPLRPDPAAPGRWLPAPGQGLRFPLALPAYCACACAVFGLANARRAARRERAAANRCPACGYDLTGNVSGVCPECGAVAKPAKGAE